METAGNQQGSQAAVQPGWHHRLWRVMRWGLALLLAGIAAWLTVRQIRWPVLQAVLTEANLLVLGVALATVLVTTAAKAARWHVWLHSCGTRVSIGRVLRVLLIGQMGNIFLPVRLGDVGRSVLVGRQTAGGIPAVLVTGYAAHFLPSLPAQVGMFEYTCLLALTAAGLSPEQALAFGLVLYLLVYGPPAILGPLSMAVDGLNWASWKDVRARYLGVDDHVH